MNDMIDRQAHQITHSGERKHCCDLCGKQFAYRTSLVQHIRCLHGGERPFACPHCGKSFSQNGNLQVCRTCSVTTFSMDWITR